MYYLEQQLEIAASHQLLLDYGSQCGNQHGHNWLITVYLRSESLDQNGMVMDFLEIRRRIHDRLDHKNLNDVLPCNPTAENLARWCQEQLGARCYRVEVRESRGNLVRYEAEDS